MKEFLSEALTDEEATLCAEAAQIYEENERNNDDGTTEPIQDCRH